MEHKNPFNIKIPDPKFIGLIIGKGGAKINQIQAQSGARCKVITETPEPYVKIVGNADQIKIAEKMINNIIQSSIKPFERAQEYSFILNRTQIPTNSQLYFSKFKGKTSSNNSGKELFFVNFANKTDGLKTINKLFEHMDLKTENDDKFNEEVSTKAEVILQKAFDINQPLEIKASFGKVLFYPKLGQALPTDLTIGKFLMEIHGQSKLVRTLFHYQFYNKETLLQELKGKIQTEEFESDEFVCVHFGNVKNEEVEYFLKIKIDKGLLKIDIFSKGKKKHEFIHVLNGKDKPDLRVFLKSYPQSDLDIKTILDNFEIDLKNKNVTTKNELFKIREFRFVNKQLFKIADKDVQFEVQQVYESNKEVHFELEIFDKKLKDYFLVKDYKVEELKERIIGIFKTGSFLTQNYNFIEEQ